MSTTKDGSALAGLLKFWVCRAAIQTSPWTIHKGRCSHKSRIPADELHMLLFKKTFWLVEWVKESSFFLLSCDGYLPLQRARFQSSSLHSSRLLLFCVPRINFASNTHNFYVTRNFGGNKLISSYQQFPNKKSQCTQHEVWRRAEMICTVSSRSKKQDWSP